jgi:hypothetical protein
MRTRCFVSVICCSFKRIALGSLRVRAFDRSFIRSSFVSISHSNNTNGGAEVKTHGNRTYCKESWVALPSAAHANAARSKSRAKRSVKDAETTRRDAEPACSSCARRASRCAAAARPAPRKCKSTQPGGRYQRQILDVPMRWMLPTHNLSCMRLHESETGQHSKHSRSPSWHRMQQRLRPRLRTQIHNIDPAAAISCRSTHRRLHAVSNGAIRARVLTKCH